MSSTNEKIGQLIYQIRQERGMTQADFARQLKTSQSAVNRIEHWDFESAHPMDKEVERASYETISVYGRGHQRYYRNVIDTLRGAAPPDTDGREGLRSLEILIATYLSARDGRRVTLPLE